MELTKPMASVSLQELEVLKRKLEDQTQTGVHKADDRLKVGPPYGAAGVRLGS